MQVINLTSRESPSPLVWAQLSSSIPPAERNSVSCTRTLKQIRCTWVLSSGSSEKEQFCVYSSIADTDIAFIKKLTNSLNSCRGCLSRLFLYLFIHVFLIKEYVYPLGGGSVLHQTSMRGVCVGGWLGGWVNGCGGRLP